MDMADPLSSIAEGPRIIDTAVNDRGVVRVRVRDMAGDPQRAKIEARRKAMQATGLAVEFLYSVPASDPSAFAGDRDFLFGLQDPSSQQASRRDHWDAHRQRKKD